MLLLQMLWMMTVLLMLLFECLVVRRGRRDGVYDVGVHAVGEGRHGGLHPAHARHRRTTSQLVLLERPEC